MSFKEQIREEIAEAGNKLLQRPSSLDELLPLLDRVEWSLSTVEQSPGQYMYDTLSPLMKALVANDLLRHSDLDVKAAVASCLSEIIRITAPDAPYDDDKMKDVFQLIVSSFENLHDQTSRSYNRRVLILETAAKVQSFVLMLDLECDRLITEMFRHFLKAISHPHTRNIISSMETIMILLIEESEEVSLELLTPLLASVKKDKEVTPTAKMLGETVFINCAAKLQPCLKKAVESLHISLAEYDEIVTLVLKGDYPAVDHVNDTVSKDLLAAESKLADLPEAVQATQEPETTHRQSAHKESKGPAMNVAPSSRGQSQPDESLPKKGAWSKQQSLNKEDSVSKKGSEATSDIEAKQARRPLKKALSETSHKESEGGSSGITLDAGKLMQYERPRADDEVNTQKRVKKPVKTRKWLSFPMLIAGLRANDEMAISKFNDFLLIEWSPASTRMLLFFNEMLRRARLRNQESDAASFLRMIFMSCTQWPETSDLVLIDTELKEKFKKLLCSRKFTSLGLVFAGVWSDQADLQLLATQKFRQLFIEHWRPPSTTLIIEFGVIPRFDELLGKEKFPILQDEAALALIDITSRSVYSIEFLMNHKLVEILIKVLDFQNSYVRDQAVLVLREIAEYPEGRDLVHRHEAVRLLVEKVFRPLLWGTEKLKPYKEIDKHLPTLRIATHALLRFCKGASRLDVDDMEVIENKYGTQIVLTPAGLISKGAHLNKVSEALPTLVQLVQLSDEEVLINACSVLACLTDDTYWKTPVGIDKDTCKRLVKLLEHKSPSVVTPTLSTLGNIVARDDIQSQHIADPGTLSTLWNLLSKNIEEVEVWRIIAKITKANNIQTEEEHKLKVKENLDKSEMSKLSLLCFDLDIPDSIVTPRKEDIVAKLMNFLDPPHAMISDYEKEESRKGKKRKRESAEQMSHQGESRKELSSEDTPSDDQLCCAIGDIFKEVDITLAEVTATDILKRLCQQFGTDLTPRSQHIGIMMQFQLHRLFSDDEDDED